MSSPKPDDTTIWPHTSWPDPVARAQDYRLADASLDALINRVNLLAYLQRQVSSVTVLANYSMAHAQLLAPIGLGGHFKSGH